jgi:hypothetical protein
VRLLPIWKAEAIVIVHASRRTTIHYARERIEELCGKDASRIHLLMDHRTNRQRFDRQLAEAQAHVDAKAGVSAQPEVSQEETETN